MNPKKELQDLLDKVDRHFVVDETQYHDKDVIVGTIAGQPARLWMRHTMSLSTCLPQVYLKVIMNDQAVMHWGCVGEEDTSYFVQWFLSKHESARNAHFKLKNSMKDVWDALK